MLEAGNHDIREVVVLAREIVAEAGEAGTEKTDRSAEQTVDAGASDTKTAIKMTRSRSKKESPEARAARKLEENGRAVVAEMREIIAKLKCDLNTEDFPQVIELLRAGYFPAFENVARGEYDVRAEKDTNISAEDNVYQASSSLNQLARFGVEAGDIRTLEDILHTWENIRRSSPEIGARVGAEMIALQPALPAKIEEPVVAKKEPAEAAEADEDVWGYESAEPPNIRGAVRGLIVKAVGTAVGTAQGGANAIAKKVQRVFTQFIR